MVSRPENWTHPFTLERARLDFIANPDHFGKVLQDAQPDVKHALALFKLRCALPDFCLLAGAWTDRDSLRAGRRFQWRSDRSVLGHSWRKPDKAQMAYDNLCKLLMVNALRKIPGGISAPD